MKRGFSYETVLQILIQRVPRQVIPGPCEAAANGRDCPKPNLEQQGDKVERGNALLLLYIYFASM